MCCDGLVCSGLWCIRAAGYDIVWYNIVCCEVIYCGVYCVCVCVWGVSLVLPSSNVLKVRAGVPSPVPASFTACTYKQINGNTMGTNSYFQNRPDDDDVLLKLNVSLETAGNS